MKNKETLYLIDGSSIAYRSYFAMLRSALSTTRGKPTGASFAFTNSLLKLLREQEPDYVALVFDAPEKPFAMRSIRSIKPPGKQCRMNW